jgi:hypothetical protein
VSNTANNGATIAAGDERRELRSLSAFLRGLGLSGAAISAALLVTNKNRCESPLSDAEVVEIAHGRRTLPAGQWATRYGLAALAGILEEMQAAPEGERNTTLHRLARRCGRLVAGGQLAEEVATIELCTTAVAAGLPAREVRASFRSGFAYGLQFPVVLEERP